MEFGVCRLVTYSNNPTKCSVVRVSDVRAPQG